MANFYASPQIWKSNIKRSSKSCEINLNLKIWVNLSSYTRVELPIPPSTNNTKRFWKLPENCICNLIRDMERKRPRTNKTRAIKSRITLPHRNPRVRISEKGTLSRQVYSRQAHNNSRCNNKTKTTNLYWILLGILLTIFRPLKKVVLFFDGWQEPKLNIIKILHNSNNFTKTVFRIIHSGKEVRRVRNLRCKIIIILKMFCLPILTKTAKCMLCSKLRCNNMRADLSNIL